MESNYSASPSGGELDNLTKAFSFAGAFSWALFIITGWISFFVPDCYYWEDDYSDRRRAFVFWIYESFRYGDGLYHALYTFFILFYIVIIISLIWSTAGLLSYIYLIIIKKDSYLMNEMFGLFSRYHFIPFLCASILSIISECTDTTPGKAVDFSKFQIFLSIIFSFLGLCSLGFIYLKTKFESSLYAKLAIRGTYSCLMALFSFSFFYNFYFFGYKVNSDDEDWYELRDWVKGTNYAFSIIFGAINLGLSVFFKDLVLSVINCLIYIGMTINFFLIDDEKIEVIFNDKRMVGVIDIIIAIGSAGVASFIFIKYNPIGQIFQRND